VLSVSLLSPAVAQDKSAGVIEEVYVTASKRDERLLEVPMAVTAIGGEALIQQNLLQIEDFVEQVPALSIEKLGARATRVILRGLNAGGASATVATMIDEAVLSYASGTSNGGIDIANIDPYDLARVEVLRGPQGTLYGAAAVGGIVKYVTTAPNLEQVEGDLEGTWESIADGDGGYTMRGMVNVPLAEGKAAFRATGFYKELPGFIDNPLLGRDDANSGERQGARAQLLYVPTDRLSIRLLAMMQDQEYDDFGAVEVVGAALTPGERSPSEFDIANGGNLQWNTLYPSISDNETRLYALTVNWELGNVNLLSATSYGEINSTFRNDISSLEAAPGFPFSQALGPLFGVPEAVFWGNQTNDLEKTNQEFRLTSIDPVAIGSVNMDWQLGAFYSKEDVVFNQFFDAIDPDTGAVLLSDIFAPLGAPQLPAGGSFLPADYEEYSVFGEVVLHLSEKFEIALGGRYSDNEQFSQVTNAAGVLNGPFDVVNDPTTSSEDAVTWSIAPKYYLGEDQVLYARIASGYRPGGPVLTIPGATPDFPTSYDADTSVNYELGIKGRSESGRFSYDVAAFFVDWEDIQILTQFVSPTSGQTFNVTGNAGLAESLGLEWNLSMELLEGLAVSVNGAWVQAELTEDAPGLGGVKGDQLPATPELSYTINLDYSTMIGNTPVSAGLSWRYSGERYNNFGAPTPGSDEPRAPGSHVEMPSYETLAANIQANFGKFRVRVFGRNLTDEIGLNTYNTGGGYQNTGRAYIIQPRTLGVSVGYEF
jgi:outer membrane receptor protein involved in Fe transport